MPGLLPDIDPDGLLEYSVVYTDRSVNHMSVSFQTVMNDISRVLGDVYNAEAVVVVPGSGTYGMEAVARQFATGEHVLVVRNGWFSYRWTQLREFPDWSTTTGRRWWSTPTTATRTTPRVSRRRGWEHPGEPHGDEGPSGRAR